MVSSICTFSRAFVASLLFFWFNYLIAQDSSSLFDVAKANGDSMRNYDVSYKKTTIVNLPKDTDQLREIQQSYREAKVTLWDEVNEIGRIVVDKEAAIDAKKLFFIRSVEYSKSGKVEQRHTEFVIWVDGNGVSGTSRNPTGEIGRAKINLEQLYRQFSPPSFETFAGNLRPPQLTGYWDDHSVYWDMYKSGTANFEFQRLSNGKLRLLNETPEYIYLSDYDPVSMLMVSYRRNSTKESPEVNQNSSATFGNITWENYGNVYRLRSILARDRLLNVSHDISTSFHWHQFNEDEFVFPMHLWNNPSTTICTSFLIDGQSEILKISSELE